MRNHETGLDYAKFDLSDFRNSLARQPKVPTWQGAWLWCLKHRDKEAAQLIYDANNMSLECEYRDHDYCPSPDRCTCVHHRTLVLKAEGPQIPGCANSEQEEMEVA